MTLDLVVRGGTIVDGSGAARFSGDVGIKDGRVVAIGVVDESASEVIDATGKSLMPGLVMLHEHLYYPTGPGVYGQLGASFIRLYLAGGVTTIGLVYDGGIFPGRVGVAHTAARGAGPLTLKTDAGQVIAFGNKRGGVYPATGIGAVAYIRQAILDAQYEARVDKAFKAGIPGGRPAADPFRRALMPMATNDMSAWFVAATERQLVRASEIAKEMGLKSPVVVGASEGWRVIPNLKAMGATAVVSLQFMSPDSVTGREFLAVGMGKTGYAPPATAADTAEVRGNAGALAKAGVPVALASFGGESGATFRDRIRMAIAAGLSADDALKAATVTPAAVLGVTAAVGTIEVGKLANFVVVTGNDLFAAGTPIKHVFVEGRLY